MADLYFVRKKLNAIHHNLGQTRIQLEANYEFSRTRIELILWTQRTILLVLELLIALKSLVLRLIGKDGRRKYIVSRYDGFGNLLGEYTRFEGVWNSNDKRSPLKVV